MTDRKTQIVALALTVMLGILSRVVHLNNVIWDKHLGDALYAVMLYILLGIIFISLSKVHKAIIAFFLMCILEVFQLTNIPLAFIHSHNIFLKIIGILLGERFSFLDIFTYFVGIAGILIIDYVLTFFKVKRHTIT